MKNMGEVGGWGGGWYGNKTYEKRWVDFIYLIVAKIIFLLSVKIIDMDVHIDTIAIDFLNNSGFFVICLIHFPLGLLWELHSQDMKIRIVLYLRCLDYNNISQKGYQRNYDKICDFLMGLNSLNWKSMKKYDMAHIVRSISPGPWTIFRGSCWWFYIKLGHIWWFLVFSFPLQKFGEIFLWAFLGFWVRWPWPRYSKISTFRNDGDNVKKIILCWFRMIIGTGYENQYFVIS